MAKRRNPYVDDFVQQSKTHIGIKQFNNNEVRVKDVYEKTLQLLFNGARKCHSQEITLKSEQVCIKKDFLKQLTIGNKGTLVHTTIVTEKKLHSFEKCKCGNTVLESKCEYCECCLCRECQHQCVNCKQPFCSRCSVSGLDGSEVCVSCYS